MRCCVWLMGWAILAPAILCGQTSATKHRTIAETAESIASESTLVATSAGSEVKSGKQQHKQSHSSPQHSNSRRHGNAEHLGALFDAMHSKQVEVKVVAIGAHQANVILTNKTDAPVTVQLPDHFAAVHVLGQPGGPGLFGGGGQLGGGQFGGGQFGGPGGQFGGQQGGGLGNGQGGGNQAIGGGFNQGGGGSGLGNLGLNGGGGLNGPGFGGGGQAGGFFRLEPERPRKLEATMVCLEYGKPDPNPRLPYQLVPLEAVTKDKAIAEVCRNVSQGNISQRVAQAMAWHLANGLDWEKLSKINRSESHLTGAERFFTQEEIEQASQLVRRWKTMPGERGSHSGATSRYTSAR